MSLRQMQQADLAACSDVFFAAEDELYDRHSVPRLPRNTRALERLLGHLLAGDAERAWVAEEDGRVLAFGMASQRDRFWFLSFLFVLPAAQGQGLGRELLQRCLPVPGSADVLATCAEAIQPVATGLYASHGLVPRTPLHALVGTFAEKLPALPRSLSLVSFAKLAGADEGELVETVGRLDRDVLGFSRPADHRLLRAWDRLGFLLRAPDGEPLGYGYASTAGRLGPVLVRDAAHLLPMVAELTALVPAVGAWQVIVPGPAAETTTGLLRAGLRYDGPPALLCATGPGPDLERYLPGTYAIL